MSKYTVRHKGEVGDVTVPCEVCGEEFTFEVKLIDLYKWRGGELIQNVMPYLTADKRELLISNTCSKCFEKLFAEPEMSVDEKIELITNSLKSNIDPQSLNCGFEVKLEYPPKVVNGDGIEVDYSLYENARKHHKVGDVIRQYVSAPGTGHRDIIITRIDGTGVYAIELENTIRELDPSEVE